MTTIEAIANKHKEIKEKLTGIDIPNGKANEVFNIVGDLVGVTSQTVRNYKYGMIKDGYLAEAIYKELKRTLALKKQ